MSTRSIKRRRPGRIIAVGITLSLFLLAAVTVMTHLAYQQSEAELVIERDAQLTFLSAFRLKSELDKFSVILQNLTRSDILQSRTMLAQSKSAADPSFLMSDFDGGVVRLDIFGRVVNSEPQRPEIINQDWSNREYFRQMLSTRTVAYSNSLTDGPDGQPVVVIGVPILDENGQISGALAGMFLLGQKSVSSFYASIVRLRLGQSGRTLMVDGYGMVLYDSRSELVGHYYPEQSVGIDLDDQSGAVRTVDANGAAIVTSFASIPGTPWMLITEDEWSLLTVDNRKYINFLLFLMILGITLSTTGLFVFIRMRNREIDKLLETENEMMVSRQLKQKLLPRQIPILPGWKLNVYHEPAAEVSGDYYDFMHLHDGRLLMVMAEISGKGMPAMMKMSTLRAGIRGAGQRLLPPAEALEFSSALLCSDNSSEVSIKCLVGIFDATNGRFEFASAGQSQAYQVNGAHANVLTTHDPPLSTSLENHYEPGMTTLQRGERLLLSCDSVVNVRNPDGEKFGEDRLLAIFSNDTEDERPPIDRLISALREFSGKDWEPEGDLTILMLESIQGD